MTTDEFRARLAELPEPDGDDFWSAKRRDLHREAGQNDADTFLNWASVRATMFVGTGAYWTTAELAYLRQQPDWHTVWQVALEDAPAGQPELLPDMPCSGNLVQHAYHLCLWQNTTGLKVKNLNSIVEVGGGYGAMRYLVSRLGFWGEYTLYDNPEYLELQRYFLRRAGLSARLLNDVGLLSLGVMPLADLLIGVCSLSEMPLESRLAVLDGVPARHYLIRYQDNFEGIDNEPWFRQHLPNAAYLPAPEIEGHTYLIT